MVLSARILEHFDTLTVIMKDVFQLNTSFFATVLAFFKHFACEGAGVPAKSYIPRFFIKKP